MMRASDSIKEDLYTCCLSGFHSLTEPATPVGTLRCESDGTLHLQAGESSWRSWMFRLPGYQDSSAATDVLRRVSEIEREWKKLGNEAKADEAQNLAKRLNNTFNTNLSPDLCTSFCLDQVWDDLKFHLEGDSGKQALLSLTLISLLCIVKELTESNDQTIAFFKRHQLCPIEDCVAKAPLLETERRVACLKKSLAALLGQENGARTLKSTTPAACHGDVLYQAWVHYLSRHGGIPLFHHSFQATDVLGNVKFSPFSRFALWQALRNLKRIQRLDLNELPFNTRTTQQLRELLTKHSIAHLRLASNKLNEQTNPELWEALKCQSSLQTLIFTDNPQPPTEALLAVIAKNPKLKRLELGYCSIDKHLFQAISPHLESLTSLELLNLSSSCLDDEAVPSLIQLMKAVPSLRTLELSLCFISDTGARQLVNYFETSPHPRTIRLDSNLISTELADEITRHNQQVLGAQAESPRLLTVVDKGQSQ